MGRASDEKATVKLLTSTASWFGVTYKEDKPIVQANIQQLTDGGVYPSPLWGE